MHKTVLNFSNCEHQGKTTVSTTTRCFFGASSADLQSCEAARFPPFLYWDHSIHLPVPLGSRMCQGLTSELTGLPWTTLRWWTSGSCRSRGCTLSLWLVVRYQRSTLRRRLCDWRQYKTHFSVEILDRRSLNTGTQTLILVKPKFTRLDNGAAWGDLNLTGDPVYKSFMKYPGNGMLAIPTKCHLFFNPRSAVKPFNWVFIWKIKTIEGHFDLLLVTLDLSLKISQHFLENDLLPFPRNPTYCINVDCTL